MKRTILCALAFTLGFNIAAQHQLGFSWHAGIGKSETMVNDPSFLQTETVKTSYSPTMQIGFNYNYQLEKFAIKTGLNYNFIRADESESFTATDIIENVDRVFRSETSRKIHYLRVPLIFNHRIDKLGYGLGASVSYAITDSYLINIYTDDAPGAIVGGGNALSNIDYGIHANLAYDITDKIAIDFNYYHGLADISDGSNTGLKHLLFGFSESQRSMKNRQLMLGLAYRIN